jgi:hypothetical protein
MFPRTLFTLRRPLVILALTALGAACATHPATRGEYCQERLPQIERSIEDALAGIEPWTLTDPSRVPASESPVALIASRDRESWEIWAEDRLREAQADLDRMSIDPSLREVREQVSRLANQLVIFHGYASRGRVMEMARTLESIRKLNGEALTLACKA